MTASLDRIRALHAGITPGPWKANKDGTIDGDNYAEVICRGQVECMSYCYGGTSVIEGDNLEADAAFIAAAPSIVAQLLARIDAVLDLCDRAEKGRPQETDCPENWMLDPEDIRDAIDAIKEGA